MLVCTAKSYGTAGIITSFRQPMNQGYGAPWYEMGLKYCGYFLKRSKHCFHMPHKFHLTLAIDIYKALDLARYYIVNCIEISKKPLFSFCLVGSLKLLPLQTAKSALSGEPSPF
jgi:hypothetical protein